MSLPTITRVRPNHRIPHAYNTSTPLCVHTMDIIGLYFSDRSFRLTIVIATARDEKLSYA